MCSTSSGTAPPYPFPTLPPVLARLFLVRHGEVHNPRHLCYGNLPGFGLSRAGRRQAGAAADHLAPVGAALLLSSPLRRAQETAAIIGSRLGLLPGTDERLTEWGLGFRWAGTVWEELPPAFPGELEAYFEHPADLPFSPEPLAAAAERVVSLVDELGRTHPGAQAILISHQDPLQAARLCLTGGRLADLHVDKPSHASVLTLEPGPPWRLTDLWRPPGPAAPFPPSPLAERPPARPVSPPLPPAGREARHR
jgi:broad specificity phosphatase PhoE